jgi:regulator of cell morphogenesis and NO signaling
MHTQDRTIINADMTVNEVVLQWPSTTAVFKLFGIDSCCGGPLAVRVAATKHGHDVNQVMAALEKAIAA